MANVSVDGRRLIGRPIVFNSRSLNLGGFVEEIGADALDRTRKEKPDLRALLGHDHMLLLGRYASGTLKYEVDGKGMRAIIDPPNTATGNEVVELVRRRDLDGMSFAFSALLDDWRMEGDTPVRVVRDMTVREISVVAWPAYPAASVALDSRTAYRSTNTSGFERWNDASTRQSFTAQIEQARRLKSGTERCKLCPKMKRTAEKAVAIRHGAPLCARCLSEGDEMRRREFGAAERNTVVRSAKYYDSLLRLKA